MAKQHHHMLLAVLENRFVHYDLLQLQFSLRRLNWASTLPDDAQCNSNTTITTHCTTATELLLSGTDNSSVTWRTSFKLQQCCHYFVFNPRITITGLDRP
jgi:hypothetical protein